MKEGEACPAADGTRSARQITLPEVGEEGQALIAGARIVCVGAGGLGSAALPYLASAGVGKITVVDGDRVSESNLPRQTLYRFRDVGCEKATRAQARLMDLNPEIQVSAIAAYLTAENASKILAGHDLVLDGTDQFAAKFLINDAAAKLKLPVVYAAVTGWGGQVAVWDAQQGSCYRCYQPEAPRNFVPNCAQAGVSGPVAGVLGLHQAQLALELILEKKTSTPRVRCERGTLWTVDFAPIQVHGFKVSRRMDCPTCSRGDASIEAGLPDESGEIDPQWLADRDRFSEYQLIDLRETAELAAGILPGARHWPWSQLKTGATPPWPIRPERVILYCQTGVRSEAARAMLSRAFSAPIRHLRGGIARWPGPLVRG
ncbi:MAG: ThiF family adenylyltransferase [Bacteriovoracia bacterium]